jgi:hypothetical protein
MNAAIFTKSAKGLILASGLIAASSIMGYAQDAPVALGAQATVPLSGIYVGAPTGITSLGGHTFDLSSGNLLSLNNGQSASFSGSWANATGAYLLLNSANTYLWYDQTVVGNVTLTFSDGTTQSTDLMVGGNLREWRTGAGFTVNLIADPNAAQVWSGTALDGSAAVIDMLTISLTGTKTLTSVTVNDTNDWGALAISLAGLTISTPDPAPAPAPDPTCTRPGNSCNTPAAVNSQSQKWQPSTATTPSATTPSATTPSDKHTNNGHHSK